MKVEGGEPVIDLAGGDPGVSRHLRDVLQKLSERSHDREFKELVEDVLSGRRGLRDVASSPVFARELDPLVAAGARKFTELSEEQRADLAAEGDRQLSQLGSDSRRSDRASVHPDVDEADDDYFSNRGPVLRSDW
ncbi:hypothetical protein [Rhodococcus maanshanensis]|uniref:hypothetical protein n=1 Tax=Rhodococcus maanshanensis TaxID=183556 RepID=UPI0009331978|nr:hypothetical protein [Rhodococcus maanshanensis]